MVYNRGLTLIEILVSIVITVMVMVYGLGFFVAAWKFQTQAMDYTIVLNKVESVIEEFRYNVHESSPVFAVSEVSYFVTSSSKIVELTKTVNRAPGLAATSYCYQVSILATWPVKNPDGTGLGLDSRNKISIKTHMTVPNGK